MLSSSQISDNEDIKYIASRITQYIQTNLHFLSNTLKLMYIQATDSLGYKHPAVFHGFSGRRDPESILTIRCVAPLFRRAI